MAAASNKKLSLCILLILVTLILDHINTLTSFLQGIGKFKDLDSKKLKKEYIFNMIITVCYVITLVVCLLSLL